MLIDVKSQVMRGHFSTLMLLLFNIHYHEYFINLYCIFSLPLFLVLSIVVLYSVGKRGGECVLFLLLVLSIVVL